MNSHKDLANVFTLDALPDTSIKLPQLACAEQRAAIWVPRGADEGWAKGLGKGTKVEQIWVDADVGASPDHPNSPKTGFQVLYSFLHKMFAIQHDSEYFQVVTERSMMP